MAGLFRIQLLGGLKRTVYLCVFQECYSVNELAELKEHFSEAYENAEVLLYSLHHLLSCVNFVHCPKKLTQWFCLL